MIKSVAIMAIAMAVVANTAAADLFWDQYPGFVGNTCVQIRQVGKETFLEEFALPYDDSFREETLTIDFHHVVLTSEKDKLDFTRAEAGDPWWEIRYSISRTYSLLITPGWCHIFIRIKGKWTPSKDESPNDPFGRSLVVKIGIIPLVKENSFSLYVSGHPLTTRSSVGTYPSSGTEAAPSAGISFNYLPATPEIEAEVEGLTSSTTEQRITSTWGSIRSAR